MPVNSVVQINGLLRWRVSHENCFGSRPLASNRPFLDASAEETPNPEIIPAMGRRSSTPDWPAEPAAMPARKTAGFGG